MLPLVKNSQVLVVSTCVGAAVICEPAGILACCTLRLIGYFVALYSQKGRKILGEAVTTLILVALSLAMIEDMTVPAGVPAAEIYCQIVIIGSLAIVTTSASRNIVGVQVNFPALALVAISIGQSMTAIRGLPVNLEQEI